jgi:methylated-DNA-protein-cysteine methyltransferase-like protein
MDNQDREKRGSSLLSFTERVVFVIKSIPKGKVLSYGRIASVAGNPRGARQVVRILHTQTGKRNLPWHRVINSKGKISLKGEGYRQQRILLESEGIVFGEDDSINLKEFLWSVETIEEIPT